MCVCVRLLAGGCERQRLNGPQPNGLKVYTNDCVEEKREEKSHTQRPFLKSRLFSSAKKKKQTGIRASCRCFLASIIVEDDDDDAHRPLIIKSAQLYRLNSHLDSNNPRGALLYI